jgi:peptidoglycan-associated lipoprotein
MAVQRHLQSSQQPFASIGFAAFWLFAFFCISTAGNTSFADEISIPSTVYFKANSATLSDEAKYSLRKQADWLKQNATLSVSLEGHTDSFGRTAYNQQLSVKRAQVVGAFLLSLGVSQNRISKLVGFGSERLACSKNLEPACIAQNRRVITVVDIPSK